MKRSAAHQEALDALLGLFVCHSYVQPDEQPVRYFTGGHGNIEDAADVLVAAKMLVPGKNGYYLPDGGMTRFSVTIFVEADDAAEALLAAGDLMLDTDCTVPGPNYGIRHGAQLLAALGDTVIQVREVTA